MSYRCEVCETAQVPGSAELRHPVYREEIRVVAGEARRVRQLAREVRVCRRCLGHLEAGCSVQTIRADLGLRVGAAWTPPNVNRAVKL